MPTQKITSRNPYVQQKYDEYREKIAAEFGEDAPCAFCNVEGFEQIEATKTMLVLVNQYPYESFEGRQIDEQWMIVPRRHINSLWQFTIQEREDYWNLLQKYFDSGYASLTRANGDMYRSVPLHLHTHLITYKD